MNCVSWQQAQQSCAAWRQAPGRSRGRAGSRNDRTTLRLGRRYAQLRAAMRSPNPVAGRSTAPVGSRPRGQTPEGVFDLTGNVAEWVADAHQGNARQRAMPEDDATVERVQRGGSWYRGVTDLRRSP